MKRILILATVVLVALPGCKSSSGGKTKATSVASDVAADLGNYHVESIAVLAFSNTTGDPKADEMGIYMVQAFHGKEMYYFIASDDFLRDAVRVGMEEDHARLVRTWTKKRTVDENVVERLLAATGYDALAAAEVSKWEEVKLQADQEGTSDTSVGAAVKLYGVDGTELWSASDLQTKHSPPYYPEFNTRATTGGRAVTTSQGAIPEPPAIKLVAMEVAENLASRMPNIKKDPAN